MCPIIEADSDIPVEKLKVSCESFLPINSLYKGVSFQHLPVFTNEVRIALFQGAVGCLRSGKLCKIAIQRQPLFKISLPDFVLSFSLYSFPNIMV